MANKVEISEGWILAAMAGGILLLALLWDARLDNIETKCRNDPSYYLQNQQDCASRLAPQP